MFVYFLFILFDITTLETRLYFFVCFKNMKRLKSVESPPVSPELSAKRMRRISLWEYAKSKSEEFCTTLDNRSRSQLEDLLIDHVPEEFFRRYIVVISKPKDGKTEETWTVPLSREERYFHLKEFIDNELKDHKDAHKVICQLLSLYFGFSVASLIDKETKKEHRLIEEKDLLSTLPRDILMTILSVLNSEELYSIRSTNKKFKSVIDEIFKVRQSFILLRNFLVRSSFLGQNWTIALFDNKYSKGQENSSLFEIPWLNAEQREEIVSSSSPFDSSKGLVGRFSDVVAFCKFHIPKRPSVDVTKLPFSIYVNRQSGLQIINALKAKGLVLSGDRNAQNENVNMAIFDISLGFNVPLGDNQHMFAINDLRTKEGLDGSLLKFLRVVHELKNSYVCTMSSETFVKDIEDVSNVMGRHLESRGPVSFSNTQRSNAMSNINAQVNENARHLTDTFIHNAQTMEQIPHCRIVASPFLDFYTNDAPYYIEAMRALKVVPKSVYVPITASVDIMLCLYEDFIGKLDVLQSLSMPRTSSAISFSSNPFNICLRNITTSFAGNLTKIESSKSMHALLLEVSPMIANFDRDYTMFTLFQSQLHFKMKKETI